MNLRISTRSYGAINRNQYLWRSYTSPAVNIISDQTGSVQNLKHERGVPFLFLPHTVKKAYKVHEVSTTLPKLFDKYKWLTKTLSSPGLPACYDLNLHNIDSSFVEAFHDSLSQTVAYQKSPKNKNQLRLVPERINFSLVSNFLRVAFMGASDANHLSPENSFLYHEPTLETHWPRNYKFYQTKFKPSFVVRTRNALGEIEQSQELSCDEVEKIPGPYDPYAMNMYRHHIVHLRNRCGMDNSRFNPIKHCYTTVMVRNRIRTVEQFYTLGMFTMFSQLISQAQDMGELHGTDLSKPMVSQCIVTNGYQFAFMVYQLNTLNLMDDKGIWNRTWYSPVMDMFRVKQGVPMLIYETAERGEQLQEFNEDVCKYFMTFLGKETV